MSTNIPALSLWRSAVTPWYKMVAGQVPCRVDRQLHEEQTGHHECGQPRRRAHGSNDRLPAGFSHLTRAVRYLMSATGMSDTTGTRMVRAPSLHHTEFAVSSSKNLQLPPNLKAETTTS